MRNIQRLFLTGPPKTGKSTMLLSQLMPYRESLGGFYVQRHLKMGGCVAFMLRGAAEGSFSVDSIEEEPNSAFLSLWEEKWSMDIGVFDTKGYQLLRDSKANELVLLDEIGGIDLLSDSFYSELCSLIQGGAKCIGVFKSEQALGSMIRSVAGAKKCIDRRDSLLQRLDDGSTILLDAKDEEAGRKIATFLENGLA